MRVVQGGGADREAGQDQPRVDVGAELRRAQIRRANRGGAGRVEPSDFVDDLARRLLAEALELADAENPCQRVRSVALNLTHYVAALREWEAALRPSRR